MSRNSNESGSLLVHYKCTFNTVKCTSFSEGFSWLYLCDILKTTASFLCEVHSVRRMVQWPFSPETNSLPRWFRRLTPHFLQSHGTVSSFYSILHTAALLMLKTSKSKDLCENDNDTMSDVTVLCRHTFPYTSPPVTQTAGEIKAHECCRIICPSLIL